MKRPTMLSADDHADVLIAEVRKVADAVIADLSAKSLGLPNTGLRSKTTIEAAADVFVRRLRLEGVAPEEIAKRATIIALTVAVPVAMQHADERR